MELRHVREQTRIDIAAKEVALSLVPKSPGQKDYLRSHPALRGPGPAALDAWPVYRTYNDNGRRHYAKKDELGTRAVLDLGQAPVRPSSHPPRKLHLMKSKLAIE
jgi:hypothetical protein